MKDEFDDLLNQLDGGDASPDFIKTDATPTADLIDELDDLESSVTTASVIRPIEKTAPKVVIAQAEPPSPNDRVDKYADQLETVTQQILSACRADRQEAQEVIDDLRSRLDLISGPPPKSLIDGLVQAVEVKSSINQNAIKIMDTNAKFIAATKPKIGTQNNLNIGDTTEELRKILGSAADEF